MSAAVNPKFVTLAAIADLFRVEPAHLRYPLSLDPDLMVHYPLTEGAGTIVHDQVLSKSTDSRGVSQVVKRCGVLYGAAWALSLETSDDRVRPQCRWFPIY